MLYNYLSFAFVQIAESGRVLVFNTKWTSFQLCYGENTLLVGEMIMMMPALY